MSPSIVVRPIVLALAWLATGACATLPRDAGQAELRDQLAARQTAQVNLAAQGTTELDAALLASLDAPLSPDDAVALAWQLGPRAGMALAELEIAAGDAFDSRRPRNLKFSAQRKGGGESSVGLALVLSDLVRLPARRRLGEAQWQAAISRAAEALLDEAGEVRADYFRYQGALQIAEMREVVAEAAELSAELAQRFHAAGNISALQLAREEAAASTARMQAARAAAKRMQARMNLAERLGLAGRSNRWRLPDRLPLPPAQEPSVAALLALAGEQRLDLAAARAQAIALDEAATSTRRLRGFGELTVEVEREREDGTHSSVPGIELELPIFSQGQGAAARADGRSARAAMAVRQLELGIERDVRGGVAQLATLREIATNYREALIPQSEAIVARQQERYNYMLIGVFELLAAKQQEYDAYEGYLQVIRDYWLAHSALVRAVGGRLPEMGPSAGEAPALDDLLQPEGAAGHDHHGHGGTP